MRISFVEFDVDVIIQNGQYYEGTLAVPFCPSLSGCRAIVKRKDGSTNFEILENFMVTLREPNHKSVWIVSYIIMVGVTDLQFIVVDVVINF